MDAAILVSVRVHGDEVELFEISEKVGAGVPALLELEDRRADDEGAADVVVVESKLSA